MKPWRRQPEPGRRCRSALIADIVRRYAQTARIHERLAHPHVLRHTFATRFIRRHRDAEGIAALQRLLGHASPETTMVYVPVTTERLEEHVLSVAEPRATLDEDLDDASSSSSVGGERTAVERPLGWRVALRVCPALDGDSE